MAKMNVCSLMILLHHYSHSEPFVNTTEKVSKTIYEAYKSLLDMELLEQHIEGKWDYKITEKGSVHVKALLEAALPEARWVSPINKDD